MNSSSQYSRMAVLPTLGFLVAASFALPASAGLTGAPSWRKQSEDGKYLLVMVSPLPEKDDRSRNSIQEREIRAIRTHYAVSGLYHNDSSATPLYQMPYWSPYTDAFIAADGKHIVMSDDDWRGSGGHLATFYRGGSEIASYNIDALIPFHSLRLRCGFYHPRCTANVINPNNMTLSVRTDHGDQFVFDLTSGKIVRQRSPWPIYVAVAASIVPCGLLALAAWAVIRSRRIRDSAIENGDASCSKSFGHDPPATSRR